MGGILSAKTAGNSTDHGDVTAEELTEREKSLIRETWRKLEGKSSELSIEIFLKIFQIKPETKQFFPFKNAVGDALIKHPLFKSHAIRFIHAVKMAVINLDALDMVLIPNLIKLGQHHTTIHGFNHEYFEVFCLAMHSIWNKHLGRLYNIETRAAWNKIFKLIVYKVETGYLQGIEIKEERKRANSLKISSSSNNATPGLLASDIALEDEI